MPITLIDARNRAVASNTVFKLSLEANECLFSIILVRIFKYRY